MKIPLSLIRSFISIDLPPAQIGEVLTLLGIEVDKITNEAPPFSGVVVGEVLSVQKHPDAEKLQVAQVFDGKEKFTVVCGDPKCRAGMKTAFAKVGAVLPGCRIEKTKLRGVESFGMLCAPAELHVGEDNTGIFDLPQEMETGEDLVPLLWDPVFELSLTPNLGHCMSALGIARELAAALQTPLRYTSKGHLPEKPFDKEIRVSDFSLCPRYSCCLIESVRVGPSPFWLKRQLEACGQKSINHVVDVANYMMLKWGQPMHAFDYDLLEGKKIDIGPAKHPFKFLGLDQIEREVPAGTLLISDAHRPVALAGVMGGANSAVSDKTTRILLESAYFEPIAVRNAARKLGLRTESAQRFEKGIDPMGTFEALYEASQLIGGRVKGAVDVKKERLAPKQITYRPARINQWLGTQLSATEMEEIFVRLGFKVKGTEVTVPLYRSDITEEVDLIEEVARIYGYNNIEKKAARCTPSPVANDPIFVFENELRRQLVGLGLTEVLTCDLISPKLAEVARSIVPRSMAFLQATYAKTEEYSVLRASLLPGLLQVTRKNIDQKNANLTLFEIGRIHFLQEGKPVEIPMGAILLTGKDDLPHWGHKTSSVDFFDVKGMVERLIPGAFIPSTHLTFHPGRQANLRVGDDIVGSLGEIHPALLEKFGIDQRVYYAEFDLLHLMKNKKNQVRVAPLPQFPASERDWTLPLDLKTPIDTIFNAIYVQKSPLLEKIELIDLYLPEATAQKNATFRLTYRDWAKTISFEEAEKEHAKIIASVEASLSSKK